MSDSEAFKRQAAERAIGLVRSGMRLGLGTGSTARHFVDLVGAEARKGLAIVGVPTSEATADQARALGIPLTTLDETPELDLTVAGADEIDGALRLIKGGGGALLREKIVAAASERMIVIADAGKRVKTLGAFPLPVEVIPMARSYVASELSKLGGQPVWREGVVTDNGNAILDVRHLTLADPEAMEDTINGIAGVVTVGLFAHRGADVLLVAGDSGIETITPREPAR